MDVAFITQRIGRDIRASSWLFTREAVDEISPVKLASVAIPELAALDFNMIAVALTPS